MASVTGPACPSIGIGVEVLRIDPRLPYCYAVWEVRAELGARPAVVHGIRVSAELLHFLEVLGQAWWNGGHALSGVPVLFEASAEGFGPLFKHFRWKNPASGYWRRTIGGGGKVRPRRRVFAAGGILQRSLPLIGWIRGISRSGP
ncbi:MAG: hypothetical protein NVS3B6_04710 [Pseudarthrobacter sp.]